MYLLMLRVLIKKQFLCVRPRWWVIDKVQLALDRAIESHS